MHLVTCLDCFEPNVLGKWSLDLNAFGWKKLSWKRVTDFVDILRVVLWVCAQKTGAPSQHLLVWSFSCNILSGSRLPWPFWQKHQMWFRCQYFTHVRFQCSPRIPTSSITSQKFPRFLISASTLWLPFSHSLTSELTTVFKAFTFDCKQDARKTPWYYPPCQKKWRRWHDSNPQPTDW